MVGVVELVSVAISRWDVTAVNDATICWMSPGRCNVAMTVRG